MLQPPPFPLTLRPLCLSFLLLCIYPSPHFPWGFRERKIDRKGHQKLESSSSLSSGKMALDHIEKRGSLRDDFKPFYPHNMESFFDFYLEEIEDLDMENEGGTDLLHTEGDEIPVGKLCIPMDSLNELEEWDFTKDSQLQCLGPEPSKNATRAPILQNFQAPAKARSKGLQSGRRVWSMNAVPFGDASQLQPASHREAENYEEYAIQQDARRCSHCLSEKTPQWRMGPLGPKTLCNACGVRYKSGRLLPEYRPAASPTFVSSVHSNSHRKVLEIRKKKGTF